MHAASKSLVVELSDREISGAIIEACRSGDRDAFRVLYDTYKDRVYSIALYFFHGDQAAAGDITQQVFLKLITNIEKFRGDSEFSTWLHRLVVNACMDSARRVKPHKTLEQDIAIPQSQEADLERAQMAHSVREAVAAMPAKFRIAVLLRYFEDLSYEQMAKALECSMGTVASRLNRGHKMLAQRLRGLQKP